LSVEEALEAILEALRDPGFQEAVWRASLHAEERVPRILEAHPWLAEAAREVAEAKRLAVENLDSLIEEAVGAAEAAGWRVYVAETRDDAVDAVLRAVGRGGLIVFSKSMVAEELGLREALEEAGNEVWETDLGQLLVQLERGKPMHTTAPAIHLTVERAARLVREKLGLPLPPNPEPEDIVAAVRGFLREKFTRASAGVSGANAIAADTGSVVLVENEGNIRLVTGLPPVHVAVAGVEKILPTLTLALKAAIVQAAYAGLYPPTYVNVISGPSSTADIEHRRVKGAHGPREVHLVLVDNGRRRAAHDPALREQLRCVRCGRCQWECPVWRHTANLWGGPAYGGPMGVGWTAITHEPDAGGLALLCMGCRRCDEACPMEIPLSGIIRELKRRWAARHVL